VTFGPRPAILGHGHPLRRAALIEATDAKEGTVGIDRTESDRIDAELGPHLSRSIREPSQIT
jgi:hypothetical protein